MNANLPLPSSSTDLLPSGGSVIEFDPTGDVGGSSPDSTALALGRSHGYRIAGPLLAALYLGIRSAFDESERTTAAPSIAWVALDDSSTARSRVGENVEERVKQIVDSMRDEAVEDGMTLRLGTRLVGCLRDYGEACLERIAADVLRERGDSEVISHILRWMGRMTDVESFQGRLRFLVRALEAPSPTTRDGAALGLVALKSRVAIRPLRAAIDRESHESLKGDLEEATEYLSSIT